MLLITIEKFKIYWILTKIKFFLPNPKDFTRITWFLCHCKTNSVSNIQYLNWSPKTQQPFPLTFTNKLTTISLLIRQLNSLSVEYIFMLCEKYVNEALCYFHLRGNEKSADNKTRNIPHVKDLARFPLKLSKFFFKFRNLKIYEL